MPKRLEVVQFLDPQTDQFFVKRVIGLPGEVILIKRNGVFVRTPDSMEFQLSEPYLRKDTVTAVAAGSPLEFVVPENTYFLLGDNRANSHDSRDFGPVHRRYIQGKVQ